MVEWLTNPIKNHEVVGSVPALAQWVKGSGVAVSCGVGCRRGSDPTLLWLWHRPALIQPLGLGTSICRGSSPRKDKKTKK